jgi:hypothetical protein
MSPAASRGGIRLRCIQVINVATRPLADMKTNNQRLGRTICDSNTGNGYYTEGSAKLLRALQELESPMLQKTIPPNRHVRTLINITASDESDVVRDRAQGTLDPL